MKRIALFLLATSLAFLIYKNYDFRKNIFFDSNGELEDYLMESYIEETLQINGFSSNNKIVKEINGIEYFASDGVITITNKSNKQIISKRMYDMDIVDFYDGFVLGYSDGMFKVQKKKDLLTFTGYYLDSYYKEGYLYLALKNSFYEDGVSYPCFFYKENHIMKDRIYKLSKNYNYGISLYAIKDDVSYNHFLGIDGKIYLGETTWIYFGKYKYKIHFDNEVITIADRKKV